MEDLIKHQVIDKVEAVLAELPPVECPLIHRFTPGLYVRELFIPAGTMLTTKIHKTQHPFIVSKGELNVLLNGEVINIKAPHCGITMPGTRRVILAITDCVWTTIHATNKKTPEEVEEDIIEKHTNILLNKKELQ